MVGIVVIFDGVLFLAYVGADRKLNKPLLVTEKVGRCLGRGEGSSGRFGSSFPPGYSV